MTLFDFIQTSDRGDLQTVDGLRRLLSVPGIGPKRAESIAKYFRNWEALISAPDSEVQRVIKLRKFDYASFRHAPIRDFELPNGVSAYCCFDEYWPKWLTDIPSPPVIIYVRGTLPAENSIAVVGTRQPTKFGQNVVRKVVQGAATRSIGIISGLALGIDAIAHRTAIETGTRTWAILGSGVDTPSPKKHYELAEQILETGGGLISEQQPGTDPTPTSLVARNRLQSAAGIAVVIAQCGTSSGTLHTARFAIEQGRLLIVARPSSRWAKEPQSRGNMYLTDPNGCHPDVLSATGKTADTIRTRQPVADVVLTSASDIDQIWQLAHRE